MKNLYKIVPSHWYNHENKYFTVLYAEKIISERKNYIFYVVKYAEITETSEKTMQLQDCIYNPNEIILL